MGLVELIENAVLKQTVNENRRKVEPSWRLVPKESIATSDLNQTLNCWQIKVKTARSLNELIQVLKNFAENDWTLLENASMSALYTPQAINLIAAEDKDKFVMLENLAELCWQNNRTEKQPAMISANSTRSFL